MSRRMDWERRSRFEAAAARPPRKRKLSKVLSSAEEERQGAAAPSPVKPPETLDERIEREVGELRKKWRGVPLDPWTGEPVGFLSFAVELEARIRGEQS